MSLKDEFIDRDYRRAYAESFSNTMIATQLRLLRGETTQKDFAGLIGVRQSRVSAMEDENYSSWSTKTLRRIAAAKDVVFLGRFVSFGELLEWSRHMSPGTFGAIPFDQDPAFNEGSRSGARSEGVDTARTVQTKTTSLRLVKGCKVLDTADSVREIAVATIKTPSYDDVGGDTACCSVVNQ